MRNAARSAARFVHIAVPMAFLLWLEDTFRWVQEADTIFAYPMILTFHTFGLAILVGISVGIDLRILGIARRLPLKPLEGFYPLMMTGFWINVVSGILLFAPEATRWTFHPDFQLKMALVFLGVFLLQLIRVSVFRRGTATAGDANPTTTGKLLAAASIAVWVVAITAGRLTAYVDSWRKFMALFVVTSS